MYEESSLFQDTKAIIARCRGLSKGIKKTNAQMGKATKTLYYHR
jgi:hypothetical protein